MRSIDMQLALVARRCWHGHAPKGEEICPLLADLDRLLKYLEDTGLRPGYTIDPCPGCGEEHRWALLDELLFYALELRPADQTRLLQVAKKNFDEQCELYGGEDKLRAVWKAADEFFASVKVKRCYRL